MPSGTARQARAAWTAARSSSCSLISGGPSSAALDRSTRGSPEDRLPGSASGVQSPWYRHCVSSSELGARLPITDLTSSRLAALTNLTQRQGSQALGVKAASRSLPAARRRVSTGPEMSHATHPARHRRRHSRYRPPSPRCLAIGTVTAALHGAAARDRRPGRRGGRSPASWRHCPSRSRAAAGGHRLAHRGRLLPAALRATAAVRIDRRPRGHRRSAVTVVACAAAGLLSRTVCPTAHTGKYERFHPPGRVRRQGLGPQRRGRRRRFRRDAASGAAWRVCCSPQRACR